MDFYHASIDDAPKAWLNTYLGDLLAKEQVFYWDHKGDICGACEVRKSTTIPEVADIGMVVSVNYRRQGYGAFLAYQARTIAEAWGRHPICSCECDNLGSFRALSKAGFVSKHRLFKVDFGC